MLCAACIKKRLIQKYYFLSEILHILEKDISLKNILEAYGLRFYRADVRI